MAEAEYYDCYIIDDRDRPKPFRGKEYLIEWGTGDPPSWEPTKNIGKELIDKYRQEKPVKPITAPQLDPSTTSQTVNNTTQTVAAPPPPDAIDVGASINVNNAKPSRKRTISGKAAENEKNASSKQSQPLRSGRVSKAGSSQKTIAQDSLPNDHAPIDSSPVNEMMPAPKRSKRAPKRVSLAEDVENASFITADDTPSIFNTDVSKSVPLITNIYNNDIASDNLSTLGHDTKTTIKSHEHNMSDLQASPSPSLDGLLPRKKRITESPSEGTYVKGNSPLRRVADYLNSASFRELDGGTDQLNALLNNHTFGLKNVMDASNRLQSM